MWHNQTFRRTDFRSLPILVYLEHGKGQYSGLRILRLVNTRVS